MVAHAWLKNEFTEDEKCHNLMAHFFLGLTCRTRKTGGAEDDIVLSDAVTRPHLNFEEQQRLRWTLYPHLKLVGALYEKSFWLLLFFKVIVGHIFETSIKCLCFIRSQWNFVCMFFKTFWTQLDKFRGKTYILTTDFILQTCVNFWTIKSKNEKYTSSYKIWDI